MVSQVSMVLVVFKVPRVPVVPLGSCGFSDSLVSYGFSASLSLCILH